MRMKKFRSSPIEPAKYSRRFHNFKVKNTDKYDWYWIAFAKILGRYCKHSILAQDYANFYSE